MTYAETRKLITRAIVYRLVNKKRDRSIILMTQIEDLIKTMTSDLSVVSSEEELHQLEVRIERWDNSLRRSGTHSRWSSADIAVRSQIDHIAFISHYITHIHLEFSHSSLSNRFRIDSHENERLIYLSSRHFSIDEAGLFW
jgi:hypothetical protein